AREHAEAAYRHSQRDRRGIRAEKVSAAERVRITEEYERARQAYARLEKKKLATCGNQPTGGFIGFGPDRDRHLAYDRCEAKFEDAIAAAGQALRSAKRNYLSME
ncbi:MAG: hypothetical protein OEQ74_09225, partial [Gammaproteobacteria bacterium]|nr:hypothetical protein [Gammaproteobacteria bacterium]